jgi:SNF2 family DNA or RNA helicase
MLELWPHQREAVSTALAKRRVLWDMGMGTGKTRAALAVFLESGAKLALVIAPRAVCRVWSHQAGEDVAMVLDTGSVASKLERARADAQRPRVWVINYESAWREPMAGWLLKQPFDLLILDEAHKLKSPGGKASRFCARLSARIPRVLALTGTPLPQGPMDAYGLYRAIDPQVFGTNFLRFRNQYAVMGGYENRQIIGYKNTEDFAIKFDSRRYAASRDVLTLPPAVHAEIPLTLPPGVMRTYRRLEVDLIAEVGAGVVTAANALVKLLRLQQITSGFLQDDGGNIATLHDAKAEALAEILDGLPADEPLVVFARFHRDLDAIARVAPHGCLELSGRRNQLADWQACKAPVLAVQIGAGAEGVDLTRSCRAVFWSLGFSLAQYEQALARTHRPGQDRTCFYHHLIVSGSVDEKVYRALRDKRNVIEYVLSHLKDSKT